jgi:hypothetical protein
MVMPRHFGVIWAQMSRRLRGLGRELESAHEGNRVYSWGLPAAALLLCFTMLAIAGALSGVPVVEFLPIAIFEALVMAGLFVACMMPAVSPPDDRGDRGPDSDPDPTPPPSDPSVWIRLLADADLGPRSPTDVKEPKPRELAGTRR